MACVYRLIFPSCWEDYFSGKNLDRFSSEDRAIIARSVKGCGIDRAKFLGTEPDPLEWKSDEAFVEDHDAAAFGQAAALCREFMFLLPEDFYLPDIEAEEELLREQFMSEFRALLDKHKIEILFHSEDVGFPVYARDKVSFCPRGTHKDWLVIGQSFITSGDIPVKSSFA